jgi:hypothetical protein
VYYSDPLTYDLSTALKLGSSDRRASFFERFARGGFYRETTYGLGFATKTKTGGKVLSVSVPSREQLEKQARRFGREGTETFQTSSASTLREEGLSVPEIASSLGITERKVQAQLAA